MSQHVIISVVILKFVESMHSVNITLILEQLLIPVIDQLFPGHEVNLRLEKTKQTSHGDIATPVALTLSKILKKPPRTIAEGIIANFPVSPWVDHLEVAGAGFVNIFLTPQAKHSILHRILKNPKEWGQSFPQKPQTILLEFVSSNPTGPLHVGHGRGAAYGDSLANLLEKAGHKVWREYYVNDAGRQMDILTLSTWIRYLNCSGQDIPLPAKGYQGDYVIEMAKEIKKKYPDRWMATKNEVIHQSLWAHGQIPNEEDEDLLIDQLIHNSKNCLKAEYHSLLQEVLTLQLEDCQSDLAEFGVVFNSWFSEQSLFDSGLVAEVISELNQRGYLYQQDGATWFRSTAFQDEKDRVVQRENGLYTYFASDIAYHVQKWRREMDLYLNVWGADHHGYIPRVKAALQALGMDVTRLEVPLIQFVSLFQHGQKLSMSTRAGQFITLRELRTEVGKSAARFTYLLRKSDQHLDFDLDLAKEQSNDNPVYYVQYAYARIHRLLKKWGGDVEILSQVSYTPLTQPSEFGLLEQLRIYPELITEAAQERAPHLLAFYLRELARELHSFYNAMPILTENEPVKLARLALIFSISLTIKDGLTLLGVDTIIDM